MKIRQPKYPIGTTLLVFIETKFNGRTFAIEQPGTVARITLTHTEGGKPHYEYGLSLDGIPHSNYIKIELTRSERDLEELNP